MNIRMNKTRKTQWQLLQQLPSNKKTNNTSKRYKKNSNCVQCYIQFKIVRFTLRNY